MHNCVLAGIVPGGTLLSGVQAQRLSLDRTLANHQPVLVLEQDALRELWPPEAARIVEMRLPPEEKMARLHRLDGTCRWSLLPFCAVGTEAGLLLAVRSDYVKVGSITYPRILLALTPGAVSDGGGYQALWGGRKERRHGKSAAADSAVAQRPAG